MFRRSATLPLDDAPLNNLPPCESSALSQLELLLPQLFDAQPPILDQKDVWTNLTSEQKQNLALRFLRYQSLKVDKAYAHIERCIQWRCEEKPFQKDDSVCMGRKTGLPLLICEGRGRDGEILAYGPAKYYFRAEVDHALHEAGTKVLFEKLLYKMDGRTVMVLDFEGFCMKNVDFVSLKNGIRVFLNYYPELFQRIILVRYSRWLYGTWKCVVPLLDNRTVRKVHWISEKDMTKELCSFFEREDIPRWLGGDGKDGAVRLFTGQDIEANELADTFE